MSEWMDEIKYSLNEWTVFGKIKIEKSVYGVRRLRS